MQLDAHYEQGRFASTPGKPAKPAIDAALRVSAFGPPGNGELGFHVTEGTFPWGLLPNKILLITLTLYMNLMPPSPVRLFRWFFLLLSLAIIAPSARVACAQDSSQGRKIVHKTMPVYPALARQINLSGTVKVVAVVTPDGKVRTVEPMGGSPILIEAAKEAIVQWKFVPAAAESREVIELHFNP